MISGIYLIKAWSRERCDTSSTSCSCQCSVGSLGKDGRQGNVDCGNLLPIGHFTVVYLVAKALIWSEVEIDHVAIETSTLLA